MTSQTVAKKSELATPANINKRISNLLENLGSKVKNFAVIDKKGQLLGEVRELVLDAENRLNLVISQLKNHQGVESIDKQLTDKYKLLQLRSQRIQKIDNSTQSIFVDLEKSEIEDMPENVESDQSGGQIISDLSTGQIVNGQNPNGNLDRENLPEIGEENIIRLLEERLVINSSKHKVGDVIVRKEIETRMVQVPVRREKLIVEQVSPEHKQLAEIDLGQEEISGIELAKGEIPEVASLDNGLTVSGLFSSPKIASLLLNAIALEKKTGCQQIRVSIVVDNEEYRQKYQEWFDRCSQGQKPNP
jgi:sporulation protein YlmC with PRC-barrel domain